MTTHQVWEGKGRMVQLEKEGDVGGATGRGRKRRVSKPLENKNLANSLARKVARGKDKKLTGADQRQCRKTLKIR